MDVGARLYAHVLGHGSHAQVSNGFALALKEAEMLAGVLALDVQDMAGELGGALHTHPNGGAFAPHGVFTGNLALMDQMVLRAKHARRWVMVAPNSDQLPGQVVKLIDDVATDVLAPSHWAAEVIRQWTTKPVRVVPHGVFPEFTRDAVLHEQLGEQYSHDLFRVLHFSTSARQRKGTWELVQAWRTLIESSALPKSAELILVLDYDAQLRLVEQLSDESRPVPQLRVLMRMNASPKMMANVLRRAHVVCQPSRGEAFGMVGLEALACGTPIVATACTGHSEWCRIWPMTQGCAEPAGAIMIESGPPAPIDDAPGALAPTVSPEAIAEALHCAFVNWDPASVAAFDAAPEVGVEWAWSRQLAPWINQLKERP